MLEPHAWVRAPAGVKVRELGVAKPEHVEMELVRSHAPAPEQQADTDDGVGIGGIQ